MSRYSFGDFALDLATGELRRAGAPVPIQPLLSALLVELASHAGELISREELATRLWPAGTFVDYENSLNNAVARLRRIIGSHRIETVPKRGYRFRGTKPRRERRPHPLAERARRRGLHLWNRTTIASLRRSLASYENAIELDPEHALAHAGLADTYLLSGDAVIGAMDPRAALPEAEKCARRALALNPDCAEALAALGMTAWRLHWDWESAERLLRASIAIQPRSATAHLYYSWLLQARGRRREADAETMRAYELDPVSPFVNTNVGWMLYTARRHSDVIAHISDALTLDEYYPMARLPLGLSLQQVGRTDEAIAHLELATTLSGAGAGYCRATLGHALAKRNRLAPAREILSQASPFDRAMVHLGLGEHGAAIDSLELALTESSSHLSYLFADPMFDGLRRERRFLKITRSIGLERIG